MLENCRSFHLFSRRAETPPRPTRAKQSRRLAIKRDIEVSRGILPPACSLAFWQINNPCGPRVRIAPLYKYIALIAPSSFARTRVGDFHTRESAARHPHTRVRARARRNIYRARVGVDSFPIAPRSICNLSGLCKRGSARAAVLLFRKRRGVIAKRLR